MNSRLFGAVLSCALVGGASAQITAFDFVDVPNSAGGSALDGFTTTDITIDFDSRWTGSQLLIELTQGSLYVDPLVDPWEGPADAFTQTVSPSTSFATYLTMNAREASEMPGEMITEVFSFRPGAVNLGGDAAGGIDSEGANAAWSMYPPDPNSPEYSESYWWPFQDEDDFLISRVTLSDDAQGTFSVLASAGGIISIETNPLGITGPVGTGTADPNQGLQVQGQITGGAFVVPEPATVGLLAASSVLVLCRRREV